MTADPNPFPHLEVVSMPKREPVRILLNGIAAIVNLFIVMLVVLGAVDLDGDQVAAIVAFIQGATALAAEVVRAQVSPA